MSGYSSVSMTSRAGLSSTPRASLQGARAIPTAFSRVSLNTREDSTGGLFWKTQLIPHLFQGKEESIALSPSQNHEDFNVNIPVAEIPAMCQAIQALKGSDRSLLFAFPQSHSLLPATVLMSPGQVRDFYQHQRLPRPVEHYNLLLGNKESFLHETRLEEQLLCLGETRLRFG